MVEKTLTEMRLGGICDHLGFGFHRYSTDEDWLILISRRCSMTKRFWPSPAPRRIKRRTRPFTPKPHGKSSNMFCAT